jgi:hypothetical protein
MHTEAGTRPQAGQKTSESQALHPESNRISIWFFIGVLLLVYGVLILGAGIHDWLRPPAQQPVLAGLHAGIWSGCMLVLLGVIYSYRFFPKKDQ